MSSVAGGNAAPQEIRANHFYCQARLPEGFDVLVRQIKFFIPGTIVLPLCSMRWQALGHFAEGWRIIHLNPTLV